MNSIMLYICTLYHVYMYTIWCTYVCVYDIQYTIYIYILLLILTYCIHVMYIVIDNICILLYTNIQIYYSYSIYILILCNNVCNIIGGYNIYIYYMGKYKSREW